mgnify:CR=1 FL=1
MIDDFKGWKKLYSDNIWLGYECERCGKTVLMHRSLYWREAIYSHGLVECTKARQALQQDKPAENINFAPDQINSGLYATGKPGVGMPAIEDIAETGASTGPFWGVRMRKEQAIVVHHYLHQAWLTEGSAEIRAFLDETKKLFEVPSSE